MSDWKPGAVAMVNNRHDATDWRLGMCILGGPTGDAKWQTAQGAVWGSVSEIRPLAVIDPESAEDVQRLTGALLAADEKLPGCLDEWEVVQNALREFAAPTPPRPDEPQGLGAVVEDAAGGWWVRTHMPLDAHWRSADFQGNYRPWGALDAVRVLSEGVTR